MEEIEVWKDVPNYEGIYKASSFGRVKSLSRLSVYRKDGSKRRLKERILKPSVHIHGYLIVRLTLPRIERDFGVHQVIAMTFLNHIPNGHEIVVDHINGDILNNNYPI